MKNFPRIARLSTLGIVHHQNFDYEFNAFRTDFVGEGGAGKSMIADLLQLIFVGTAVFRSPTNSTGERKPHTMVLKTDGKGTDIAYAFLNIEISTSMYLVMGIYLESSGHSNMFIIQDGTDFNEESKLKGFGQLLGCEDFVLDDTILPLDQFKDHIHNSKSLVCDSKHLALYHKILYNNNIIPLDLSTSRKTLENFAKIIQAFSREALDISKSEKLQNFLFGEEKEKEFIKDFNKAVEELTGDVRQYEINSAEIEKLMLKQQALQEVVVSKQKRDASHVIYVSSKYRFLLTKFSVLQDQIKLLGKNGHNAQKEIELLERNAKAKLEDIEVKLSDIEQEHKEKYTEKILWESKSKEVAQYFSWLEHFNCSSEKLLKQYRDFHESRQTVNKIVLFSKSLEDKEIRQFVEDKVLIARKSLLSISELLNEFKEELVLKNRLKSFNDLTNKASLAYWAYNIERKLTLEEESIILKYHNEHVLVSNPENRARRYVPNPENLLSVITGSRIEKDGFWIDLHGIFEFCRYTEERIFDTTEKENIKHYFEAQSQDIAKDIKCIEENIRGYEILRGILEGFGEPDTYIQAWNDRRTIKAVMQDHAMYEVSEHELLALSKLFERGNEISDKLKVANQEYSKIDNVKIALATFRNNLQTEIEKFEKIEISSTVYKVLHKYELEEDSQNVESDLKDQLQTDLGYYEIFKIIYAAAKRDLLDLNEITVADSEISEMKEEIRALEIASPQIQSWVEQIEHVESFDLDILQKKYTKADAEFMLSYNTVARDFLKENSKRLENSGDFSSLCSAILPPEVFDHAEMLDEEIIEKINKYLRDINTKNQTLNGRKLQKLSHIVRAVDDEVSAQMHDLRTIKTFFSADDKAITGGHHVFLDTIYEGVYPKEWMRKFTDGINSDFSSGWEESLFTPTAMASELERFPSLMEKMHEAFYKCGGPRTLKPSIEQLLNPKSYYDLKFSIKSEHGKKNDGSTSQTYAAIALLCMARLTLLDRNQQPGKVREGIRFMAIDEAEGLGSNFDMLFKIARANDYQILSLSINPNKVDAKNQNIYLLHNNPDYDDVNYEPIPIFGLNNVEQ